MTDECAEPPLVAIQTAGADILLADGKLGASATPGSNDAPSQPAGMDIVSSSDNTAETTEPTRAMVPAERAGTAVVPAVNDVPGPIEPGSADLSIEIPAIKILPGEDPKQFYHLHQKLIEEWEPSGPIEEDAVLTLAIDLWRKQRVRRWRQRRLAFEANGQRRSDLEYLEKEPAPFPTKITDPTPDATLTCGATHIDEFVRLLSTSNELAKCENPFWAHGYLMLLPRYEEYLSAQVPRAKYDDNHIRDYVRALKHEIDTVLLPQAQKELREKFGSIDEERLLVDALAPDRMIEELDMESRLDAAIDRSLKRLKTMKTKGREKTAQYRQTRGGTDQFAGAAWGRVRYVQ